MTKIKVQDNQTIFDIALMYTGSIDTVMDILLHNGKVDDTLYVNEILVIPTVINQAIVDYISKNKVVMTTSTFELDLKGVFSEEVFSILVFS